MGAIHGYVSDRYVELRFGNAVESAFEQVRGRVDRSLVEVLPGGQLKLAAAFENVSSDNPEHWANAAGTCRRLLKDLADSLRPPGEDVEGRKMGSDNYVNRLVDWIVSQGGTGKTMKDLVAADLEFLGRRLDASADAGHKGAHAEVSQAEASRYIVGTYLLVGDILGMRKSPERDSADEQ